MLWCAGLDRAGPGGAACRLMLAALRGRSVQIVTSAGQYVLTKFPILLWIFEKYRIADEENVLSFDSFSMENKMSSFKIIMIIPTL